MNDEERTEELKPDESTYAEAPEFELPDDRGQFVRLEELRGEHPVVLYFARSFG